MKLSCTLISAILAMSVSAMPAPSGQVNSGVTTSAAATASRTTSAAAVATSVGAGAGAGAGTGAEAGEGEGEGEGENENEVEQQGAFGRAIALGGGNVKIDTLFPPTDLGLFEVEFQNQNARTMTVTQNQNPTGAAPEGFDFLEPVSYTVKLRGGTRNLTLQKIDWIRGNDGAAAALDISQGKIGKLCSETNSFVISDSIGELEFEVEENELTLKVDNLNGQWAVFLPKAGGGAAAGGGTETATGGVGVGAGAGAGAGANTGGSAESCGAGTLCRSLLDVLEKFTGGAAAAAKA